uniref:Histone-lysine N-methyltransferase 2D n=1 Tax=Paramormyrops kingsleyae TaxID=1676925 RepID=A0A3B3S351_9TELE|nr:histone-lysine N-methyltransferase 2D-like [Paramormyrops kingsleyae]XP_023687953.1 histone-lysine N-methyltransferase 2D-like [Paramormyrops kingsleyae]XP_023687962.1 histone-lysine N-methyltransferase 2D-like [Paramormyrops kingsleyae]
MDNQKSNCEENDSESAVDGSAPPEKPAPPDGDPEPPERTTEASSAAAEIGRACALCNCDERSLHGQRELRRWVPSLLWSPLESPAAAPLPAGDDDLSSIGFPDHISTTSLFDENGHCWVHYCCAVWSEEVKLTGDQQLEGVDRAVISGIRQRCEYCKRLGATIRCRAEGCSRFYHFPCSAASGSFQSMKLLALLCPEHIDKMAELAGEESRCAVCDSAGELPSLLFCTGCGQHYHAGCLEISATPLQRSGWQCPECKVCQTCRQPGEDSMMLVCDACDKGYHTFCLEPAMESLPSDPWKCRRCRVCSVCGSRGSALSGSVQWFEKYSVCGGCHVRRSLACCVCDQGPESPTGLHPCQACGRSVHMQCASQPGPVEGTYTCHRCRQLGPVVEARAACAPLEGESEAAMPSEPLDPGLESTTEEEKCVEEHEEQPSAAEEPEREVAVGPTEQPPLSPEPQVEFSGEEVGHLEAGPCPVPVAGERDVASQNELPSDSRPPALSSAAKVQAEPGAEGLVEEECKEQEETESLTMEQLSVEERDTGVTEGLTPNEPPAGESPHPQTPPMATQELEYLPMEGVETEPHTLPEAEPRTSPPSSVDEVPPSDTVPENTLSEEAMDECAGPAEEMHGEVKIEPESQEMGSKQELLLDEMSNLSHGDGSSSGFLGSPGEPDCQSLSAELGLGQTGRSKSDSLLTETDDSLPFDALNSDGDKVKRRGSPGRSRVKQGRGSSFPGKRRPRGSASGRGRGRSRLKAMASCIEAFLQSMDTDTGLGKDEEEEEDDTMQNTVVLFSNTDKFVLQQDMCVVCGSFGRGVEGQLLACAQCAQCYHPYCVNSKISKMMLSKGWRCLECIVCEVCGKASDPARLLLCDDCDVSYHTYCLDPPLHTVPKGGWKCKWCVCCMQCGASSPGFHCEWQNNYTHCGPCASLVSCPVCRENFMEEELLMQCQHCDRWMHAVCEGLYTEDEAEQASDEGFVCTACSPYVPKPPVLEPPLVTPVKVKEPEPQFYRLEGVWLTETGMSMLRGIALSPVTKRRQRRSRTLDGLELKDGEGDAEKGEGCGEPMESEPKAVAPGSPDREPGPEGAAEGEGVKGGAEETDDGKKRKRKPYRPGIGGFMVRQRKSNPRAKKGPAVPPAGELDGLNADKATDEDKLTAGAHPDTPANAPSDLKVAEVEGEQAKKRRGRKKSKLEDAFPGYLQEAFFGKTLLDLSKKALLPPAGQRQAHGPLQPPPTTAMAESAEAKEGVTANLKQQSAPLSEAEGNTDADVGAVGPLSPKDQTSHVAQSCSSDRPEGGDSLSSEQFFRKVLGVQDGAALGDGQQGSAGAVVEPGPGEPSRSLPPGGSLSSSLPSAGMMDSFPGLSQSPFLDSRDRPGFFSPDHGEDSTWATPSTPALPSTPSTPPTPTEPEGDGLSYSQRSLQRWEKDEELGELSTISPVLYANLNFPSLKQDFPDWSSRCKQIMKMWRKISAADKVPFLQKAKDNRAAQRISKAQKQSEVQLCRSVKTERPDLHLHIPPPLSGSLSTPSQPSSAESPFSVMPGTGTPVDPFSALTPQSPHPQSAGSPLQALSSGKPPSGLQLAPQGQPGCSGPQDTQPSSCRSPASLPKSPQHRVPGGSPLLSPPHSSPFGDPPCNQKGGRRQEHSTPSPLSAASPGGMGQQKLDLVGIPPSRAPSAGSADVISGSATGLLESGDRLFKTPMTPRAQQGDATNPAGCPLPGASPSHLSESFRQSPSASFSDIHAQPALTPRPQSGDGCSPLSQRPLLPQADPSSRVAASPQSPLSTGTLSSEAFPTQSPVPTCFQSPEPYSRPPSRPQSCDPFASLQKPPRPTSVPPQGNLGFPASTLPGQLPPVAPPLSSIGDPLSGKPPGPPALNCNPSMGVFPGATTQVHGAFGESRPPQVQPQPAQPQVLSADSFPSRLQPPTGASEPFSMRAQEVPRTPAIPGSQEPQELHVSQDLATGTLSQSDLEKHRQKQRLRELLMQRNSLRQEKAAAAANNSATPWPGENMPPYQADKSQRAPPPYPQDRAALVAGYPAAELGKKAAVSTMGEKLGCPIPPGMPALTDAIGIRQTGQNNPQGFHLHGQLPAQWPGQSATPRRFLQPAVVEVAAATRHHSSTSVGDSLNIQRMPGISSTLAMTTGPPAQAVQGGPVPGTPPQFIELRHNMQRVPPGAQFVARGVQPRPRLFIPQQDVGAPFPHASLSAPPALLLPAATPPQVEAVRDPGLGLQQCATVLPQQAALQSPQPQQQQLSTSTPNLSMSSMHIQKPAPQTGTGEDRKASSVDPMAIRPCHLDMPAELDDPFDAKGLGGTGGDDGTEDVDDLATLDLGPDKGDDDLDNLETTDPHLDDLLKCDEFDLLAYTDPELDQADPKDTFSEQLRLVEAESEVPGASSTSVPDVKVEDKPKLDLTEQKSLKSGTSVSGPQPVLTSSSIPHPSTQNSQSSEAQSLPTLKLEESSLMPGLEDETRPKPKQLPSGAIKDEMSESVSMILGGSPNTAKPHCGLAAQLPNTSASLGTVPLGGLPFNLPADTISFPSDNLHSDLDEDPLGLPDGGGQHSPAVDLDKVESSLEASELPLLIQDLLEHEKKELQKQQQQQQQLSALQQGGITSHLRSTLPQQQAPLSQGTPQVLLAQQHHSLPQELINQQFQPGVVPRPHSLPPQQQPRLLGAAVPPSPNLPMAQQSGGHQMIVSPHQQQQLAKPPLANTFFPDTDLDKFAPDDIMDPIAKAKMVALKGIKRVMAQSPIGVPPGINRQQVSLLAQRLARTPGATDPQGRLQAGSAKEGETSDMTQSKPNPPQFVQGIINDTEQHKYEEWLLHTQQLLQMQLKFLEEQIGVHRKSRKALCAKQRTAKKAGREFAEADAEKLKLVTEEQSKIQKQLDQVRKQQKEHTSLITEYRNKQQQHQQSSSLLTPGSSAQATRVLSKLPGSVIGQQGVPLSGQPPVHVPPGGVPVGLQQPPPPFLGATQPPHPVTMTSGPHAGCFPQNAGVQGPDARLMQDRQMQLQHRMQLVQKMRQQGLMGQQVIPPQVQQSGLTNQPAGAMVAPTQQSVMNNPMMSQQHEPQQQSMMQLQDQQGPVPVQSLMGSQTGPQQQQNVMGEQVMTQGNSAVGKEQRIIENQQMLVQQQRAQGMVAQHGLVGPQQHGLKGPHTQLTPQQQNILAQRMLLSQQQKKAGNDLPQLPQQQKLQQHLPQQQGYMNQINLQQDLGRQLQTAPTQLDSAESQVTLETSLPAGNAREGPQQQGVTEGLQLGVQNVSHDIQNPKDSGILNPRTPQQPQGSVITVHVQHPGSVGEASGAVIQQQTPNTYMAPQSQQLAQLQQLSSSPSPSGIPQQLSYQSNQGVLSQTVPRQSNLQGEQNNTAQQDGQQACRISQLQQQGAVVGQKVEPQPQDGIGQLQSQPGQQASGVTTHPNPQQQQQALLIQQQKQVMMGQLGMVRGQQSPGMVPRPGMTMGHIRPHINIQALIAQNPQLRHLSPSQIQAMIAQRHQMLRMAMSPGQAQVQGQQSQAQGLVAQRPQGLVAQRPQGLVTQQQLPQGAVGQQAVGVSPQTMMMQSSVGIPLQQGVRGPSQQLQQPGMMVQPPMQLSQQLQQRAPAQYSILPQHQQRMQVQQQVAGGQITMALDTLREGHTNPRQDLHQNSPGIKLPQQHNVQAQQQQLQQHFFPHPTGAHQSSPTQALQSQQASHQQTFQPRLPGASSPFQPPQAPVGSEGSPARLICPGPLAVGTTSSPASTTSQEQGTLPSYGQTVSDTAVENFARRSSPFNQVETSRSVSGDVNGPPGQPGLKCEHLSSEKLPNEVQATTMLVGRPPPPIERNTQQPPCVENQTSHQGEESLNKMFLQNIKQEPREVMCDPDARNEACSRVVKKESSHGQVVPCPVGSVTGSVYSNTTSQEGTAGTPGFQAQQPGTGQHLLQKLLHTKNLQLVAQQPSDNNHSEINGHINSKLAMLEQKLQGTPCNMEDLQSINKKPPATKVKRTSKAVPSARKKTKKDEVGKSTEALMKQLKQELSLLPLMEPSITANLELFTPFGSSTGNDETKLKGSFGNAVLDNIPDYYSQLLTQSHLSNPPTPPSSLPPTPPPSVQHKLLNGVTTVEELSDEQKETDPPEESKDTEGEGVEVKNVDLLAALPTPPHNQNEDIRMESDEDSDAPDSIVPASSPESILGEEVPRFPVMEETKLSGSERAVSPVIPIIPCSAIPVFPETRAFESVSSLPEHAGRMGPGSSQWDKAKSSEVSVTFTLSAAAAKNLNAVMVAMAQLLHMQTPGSYEVAFPPSPGRGPEAGKALDTLAPGPSDPDASRQGKPEWVKFDASLPGCTLKKQVDILSIVKQECLETEDTMVQHCYTTNVSDLDVHHLPIYPVDASSPQSPAPPAPLHPSCPPPAQSSSSPPSSPGKPPVKSELEQDSAVLPMAATLTDPTAPSEDGVALLDSSPKASKHRSRSPSEDEDLRPKMKKWKGLRWKRLQLVITIRKGSSRKESSREVSELMERLRITLRPDKMPRDLRKCCFCHEEGDGATDGPARLLNIDVDLWVHLNCALWSTEVYETQGGALINVEVALRRGLRTRCACCQKTGATNSCNRLRCPNVYHFACAIRARCMFFKDKTMLCIQHKLKGPSEEELSNFAVFRRVYIERDEVKQIASILQRGDRVHMFRVGGLIFHAVGQLLPSQMAAFHSPTAIFPVGYEATRIYWSTRVPNRRCRYRCRISEVDSRPLFEVRVLEQGQEDLLLQDSTPDGIWARIVEQVASLRQEAAMLKLFTEHVKGEEMYGLTVHAVLRITESLPGVENCQNYVFRYGRHPLMELPLMINPTGCARSEPKILTHYKRPHTLNSTSMSKAYQSTFTGEINTPYSKQFVHSKSSQYRRLKTEWKNNVYLARSRIQGLGLYAAKDLEKHTMVIEYIGTIIRNEVANRREKIYEEQNRGIYMFRINNEHVIDATLTGGPARYVNHSCAPNCVAEVVTFDKEDKIIIISSRRIPKGEELTYDYQFDFEDDQHKIPCHCGAWNCRKWMN